MTKYKHFETESGKTITTAQFDGYSFADRMLEGLQFQITVQADGTLKAWVKPEDEDFFSDFNTTKFLKLAVEYAQGNDSFVDPESGEECWLVSEGGSNATSTNAPIPIVVQKVNPLAGIASNQPHSCGSGCNHNHTPTQTPSNSTHSIIDQILGSASQSSTEIEEETKEPVIGKFKPKRKFLNFVIGKKGGIRFHTDTAFIKGEQLSGMLEGVVFKITICDEGTINFEETDTKECTDEMIQRLIDDIDSRDVTGYMQKYIVYNLDFYDGDAKRLYLEVEEQKPIDKLASLFDSIKEEETKTEEIMEEVKVSDSALSLLDSLFGDETTAETEVEVKEEKAPQETYAQQMMREAFEEMNREKITELTERIEKKEKDIQQAKMLIKQNESNLKSASEDYRVLQTRLESLKPTDPANGYVFYVSPENKSGVVLDQALQDVVKQIAPLLKLKEDVVIDYLTKGFYTIKIAKKDNLTDENMSIEKEIYEKINKLDVTGKMSIVGNGEFEYRGELNWHKLTDKMLKMGFEQEPEFDKMCGSPSYQSEMKDSIMEMAKGLGIEDVAKQHIDSIENGDDDSKFSETPVGQTYVEYTEPTTIVILGDSPENYSTSSTPGSVQITDDETCFSLFVGGKRTHEYLGSMGFADIFTLEEYKKYYAENKENLEETGLIGGVVVPNFVGKIEVTAFREWNKKFQFSNQFNMNDFIQHQFDEAEVGFILPEGTVVVDLNEDCSLPTSILRDIKIDTIIK
jgi:hypothetical protein